MKLFATGYAVVGAERQLERSRHESRQRFAHVRLAIRSRLTRPSSLLVVTGLGILLGVWFARRNGSGVKQDGESASPPAAGIMHTYLIRFGMQRLADAWIRLRASAPQRSTTDKSATT